MPQDRKILADLFVKDPRQFRLLNDGVAKVDEVSDDAHLQTLRYELETFVCDGEYAAGLERILGSYLRGLGQPVQKAAWVSGFFGSGKSHLVKVLRHLWTDLPTMADGATPRGLARLSPEVVEHLRELSTAGKRHGGLFAASGTLGSQGESSLRLVILSLVFEAVGLPADYAQARLLLWLRKRGKLDAFRAAVETRGARVQDELRHLYVSDHLAAALHEIDPVVASSQEQALDVIRQQFPRPVDIDNQEMVTTLREAISLDGTMPCTLLVLDEVQQYIGDDNGRSYRVQEVVEELGRAFEGRFLVVGTGQTALSSTPSLQRLQDRFSVRVELTDRDVEQVTRRVVLEKRSDQVETIKALLEKHSGEISRHLQGTRLGPVSEDQAVLVADYPLLPVRRRFWESALRSVDVQGRHAQLRSQLRIVHEAMQQLAARPVGALIAADFLYDQKSTEMVQGGVLLREMDEMIRGLRAEPNDGLLKSRLCALCYLVGKLPRDGGADLGIRATAEVLADLLVDDLAAGSNGLRQRIPAVLLELVRAGFLMKVGEEYRLQSRESREWEQEYQRHLSRVRSNRELLAPVRGQFLRQRCEDQLQKLKVYQGVSREARALELHFGTDVPQTSSSVPVWIRDQWEIRETDFQAEARAAGTDSPVIFVLLPRHEEEKLSTALAEREAAQATLDARGIPSTLEGSEARRSMETRRTDAAGRLVVLGHEILARGTVLLGGGGEYNDIGLGAKVEAASKDALARLFPQFGPADREKWDQVLKRAREGAPDALELVGHKDEAEKHLVSVEILRKVGNWKSGKALRLEFEAPPYGWPRDAIDAVLVVLSLGGHLQARQGSDGAVTAKDLAQSRIPMVEFRTEAAVVTAGQRVALRKLFQDAGLVCKAGDEIAVAPKFLGVAIGKARAAGGEPPCPPAPEAPALLEVRDMPAGNDQLLALYHARERLSVDLKSWEGIAGRIAARHPRWERLLRLLVHAESIGDGEEIKAIRGQIESIRVRRSLLDDPDPVPGLAERLTGLLRSEVNALQKAHQESYARLFDELGRDPCWGMIPEAEREQSLRAKSLTAPSLLPLGTEEEVLTALDAGKLDSRRTTIEALPQRFLATRITAARACEPKAEPVTLPHRTLQTADEADAWLAEARAIITARLKDGPAIV